jgi:opacity protein-like surface antigen
MKRSKVFLSAAVVVAIASSSAMAQSNSKNESMYVELGYLNATYSDTYSNTTYAWTGIGAYRLVLGVDLADSLAVEGMYASGISDGSLTISKTNTTIGLNPSFGLYIKPKLNLNDSAALFARAGFFNTKGTLTYSGYSVQDNNTSFSYGLGASFNINKNISLNGDYMVYYNSTSTPFNGMTVGIGYRF